MLLDAFCISTREAGVCVSEFKACLSYIMSSSPARTRKKEGGINIYYNY